MKRTAILFALLFFTTAAAKAQLVRAWVSTTGMDSNPCTRLSPCRNFNAAVLAVSEGGEVVVVDSGGYGFVTIDKSVALIAPEGIHAAIAPSHLYGVFVNLAPGERVFLRNLFINNSASAFAGIAFDSAGSLYVESCEVAGFDSNSILVSADGPSDVFVRDSILRDSIYGLNVQNLNTPVHVTLNRCRIERNSEGISAGPGSRVTLRDSVVVNNQTGVLAWTHVASNPGLVHIENCLISHSVYGVAQGAIENTGADLIHVSNTMITNNSTGIHNYIPGNGRIITFQNNRVFGNFINGTFAGVASMQ